MNMTNSELRRRARETLGNKIFGQKWLMALVVYLVISAILGTASSIISISALFLTGPLMFGLHKSFLIAKRAQTEANIETAFDGFKIYSSTLLLGLMQTIFLWLWSMLFVIPGIIKAYSYSMAYYISVDHPEYDWKTCINESRRIMNGNKWKLFCLDLSFIGWYIVGTLCLFVGVLWVYPYHHIARAEFYIMVKWQDYVSHDQEPTPDDYI